MNTPLLYFSLGGHVYVQRHQDQRFVKFNHWGKIECHEDYPQILNYDCDTRTLLTVVKSQQSRAKVCILIGPGGRILGGRSLDTLQRSWAKEMEGPASTITNIPSFTSSVTHPATAEVHICPRCEWDEVTAAALGPKNLEDDELTEALEDTEDKGCWVRRSERLSCKNRKRYHLSLPKRRRPQKKLCR